MIIRPNMAWPPSSIELYKIKEHATWFSGSTEALANFYFDNQEQVMLGLAHRTTGNRFWARQVKNHVEGNMHVPIASDIADASSSFLFGESPVIRFPIASKKDNNGEVKEDTVVNEQQKLLDDMLTKSGFFKRILEAAEIASPLGSVFLKLCWDEELSEWPIPMVVQPDDAIPDFKFGMLNQVSFINVFCNEENPDDKGIYRLVETYKKGMIENVLYRGREDNLGEEVGLDAIAQTAGILPTVKTPDILCAAYIPNLLPNRLVRRSMYGRSDLQGIESLMDMLDETFTDWMWEIEIAKGRIHVNEDVLKQDDKTGDTRYNIDQAIYVKLDVDPAANGGEPITATQFAIRADQYEKTVLNLLDRIITSSGYSPQSFGLNIAGRAESGTALNIRERKSFSTTAKKQAYWEQPLRQLVKGMCMIATECLGKRFTIQDDVNIAFMDCVSNNQGETSNAIKTLSDAKAISTETKVRMFHPEWTDAQVNEEVQAILGEGSPALEAPEEGLDLDQMKRKAGNMNTQGEQDISPDDKPGPIPGMNKPKANPFQK